MSVELQARNNVVNFSHAKAIKFGNATAPQPLNFSAMDTATFGNTVKFGGGEAKPEPAKKSYWANAGQLSWNPLRPMPALILSAALTAVPPHIFGALALPVLILIGWISGAKAKDAATETNPENPAADPAAPAPDAKVDKKDPAAPKAKSTVVKEAKSEVTYKGATTVAEALERLKHLSEDATQLHLEPAQIKTLTMAAKAELKRGVITNNAYRPLMSLFNQLNGAAADPFNTPRHLAELADKALTLATDKLTNREELLEALTQPIAKLEHVVSTLKEGSYPEIMTDLKAENTISTLASNSSSDEITNHYVDTFLTPAVELSHNLGLRLANELKDSSAAKQLLTIAKTKLDDEIKKMVVIANAATESEAKTRGAQIKIDTPKKAYPYTVPFTTFKLVQKPATSKADPEVNLEVNDRKKMKFINKSNSKVLP